MFIIHQRFDMPDQGTHRDRPFAIVLGGELDALAIVDSLNARYQENVRYRFEKVTGDDVMCLPEFSNAEPELQRGEDGWLRDGNGEV